MRRLRDRPPTTFFRGAEVPRLLTLMVMLGVLVLLIDLASDPKTWVWLAPDVDDQQQLDQGAASPPSAETPDDVAAPDPTVAGPSDEDPLERDAAREEFQAITDRTPLAQEEMPAYWRLMAWEEHQTTDALLRRATKDVSFNDFYQRPDRWRGKLVQFRVHLRRTVKAEDLADNPLGFQSVYEVWGWNSDSQPYSYWLVVPRLPPEMPSGASIFEEATFVGYFLKLLRYEDHEGKMLATPLMVGRLIWHPTPESLLQRDDEWTWPWYLAGALAVIFVIRWTLAITSRSGRVSLPNLAGRTDPQQVDAWLGEAENAADDDDDRPDGLPHTGTPPSREVTGPPPFGE